MSKRQRRRDPSAIARSVQGPPGDLPYAQSLRRSMERYGSGDQVVDLVDRADSRTLPPPSAEDRRQWWPGRTPADYRPATKKTGANARLKSPSIFYAWKQNIPGVVAFADAKRVIHCVKRKVRKEVLHALNLKTGRGAKRRKPERRNAYSKISCKG